MHTTNLRKVGGSVMLSVPPAILEMLHLQAGATVSISVDGDTLVIKPQTRKRYTLDELLENSDYSQPLSQEEREWIDAPPVGNEPL
jgi:antitoxin ChpS